MKLLQDLFITFFKTGLFTFGGGYAMLPLLKSELVDKHRWLTEEELLDYFSIGQCTPGIIAINVATFCGYKLKKIPGSLTATAAMIMPSLIIIILVASTLSYFMQDQTVASAFAGIRIGVTALLANLVINMGRTIYRQSQCRPLHLVIFFLALILLFFAGVSAVFIVVLAAAAGFIPGLLKRRKA